MLELHAVKFGTCGEFETTCVASKIMRDFGFFERYDASAYCLDAPDRIPTGAVRVCRSYHGDIPFLYLPWNYRDI